MDIIEMRRENLRRWIAANGTPLKEKSLFSQLKGTGSFGEKVARRLERDYRMPEGYLDTPGGSEQAAAREPEPADAAAGRPATERPPQYAWISDEEAELVTLYRTTDERAREQIMRKARSSPRVIVPGIARNQS